jgi:hypothetical protein
MVKGDDYTWYLLAKYKLNLMLKIGYSMIKHSG